MRTRKNEEDQNQMMSHIAVECNRHRQMNEHLDDLRSFMPGSYIHRVWPRSGLVPYLCTVIKLYLIGAGATSPITRSSKESATATICILQGSLQALIIMLEAAAATAIMLWIPLPFPNSSASPRTVGARPPSANSVPRSTPDLDRGNYHANWRKKE
ncbi:hypothetical protein Cni_G21604 [Canna indica]|uniref:Uncharacterized protein n=1 Tax=Canna indica TaxID=4628 RepID=A0AAQ3KV87_9LILI|nr:hypothetical protein Cni_G21604 [Canna indica]